jgi:4-hydroxy-4-methyl-2-oxoglutarate aldolase
MLDDAEHAVGSVYECSPAPDRERLERLRRLGVATVSASLGGPLARQRLLDGHGLFRIAGTGTIVGPALTIWNPPGSVRMNLTAQEMARPGDVVVVSADRDTAQWGEVASTLATAKGVEGAIVDGVVRDVDRIRELNFSTWGARIFASQGFRSAAGLINVPVTVQGLLVRPGDIIIADSDGVFALPQALLDRAIELGERKHATEERILESVRRGVIPDEMRQPFEMNAEDLGQFTGALHPMGRPYSADGVTVTA